MNDDQMLSHAFLVYVGLTIAVGMFFGVLFSWVSGAI